MSNDFGPMGAFPYGKLGAHDEGALQMGITNHNGKVVIEFGTPVAWLGLNPQQAADLASLMVKHAREAARQTGEMITVQL